MSNDPTPPSVRERLLGGLESSIRERGYAATTVADIVRAAGTSKRTFYEQFATKEECLLVHFRLFHERIARDVALEAPSADSSYDATVGAIGRYFRVFVSEPALARAHLLEILTLGEPALTARAEMNLGYARAMQRTMATPRPDRPAKQMSVLRAVGVLGGVNEIAVMAITDPDMSLEEAAAEAIALVRSFINDLPDLEDDDTP